MSKDLLRAIKKLASDNPDGIREHLVPILKQSRMTLLCNPYLNTGGIYSMHFALVVPPRGDASYLVGTIPKVHPMVENVMRNLHKMLSEGLSIKYDIENTTRYDVRGDGRILIQVFVNYGKFIVSELQKKFPTYHDFYRVFEDALNKNGVSVNKFEGGLLKW